MGKFEGRMSELASRVGGGRLTGRVVFDQVYAAYQHNGVEFKHPAGGEALFLTKAILNQRNIMMQRLASATLRGDLVQAMIVNVEGVAKEAFERAPFEFGDLKASHNPQVRDNRRLVYNRPAPIHRLSKEELRIKVRLRNLGFGNDYGTRLR